MKNTIIKVLSVVMAMVMLMGSVLVISASAADECKHENYEQFGDPVAATCTEWGFTLYQCSDCKKAYKTEFNTFEKPHNLTKGFEWIEKEVVEATCVADAYTVNVCPVCDAEAIVTKEGTKGDAHHAWSEWTIVEATCTAAGNKVRTCATCNKEEKAAIVVEGHKWVAQEDKVVEPKCVNYCTAYGITDAKAAYGYMPYVCSDCGATRTIEILPVAYHTYVEMEAETDTCDVIGHGKGTFCKWCKAGKTATDVVTDNIKHNWQIDYTKEYKSASCEADGFCTKKCSVCQQSYVETLEKTGHDWNEENPTKEQAPTCVKWGYKLYGCTKCGIVFENVAIEPTGCDFSDEPSTVPATCTEAGGLLYICKNEGCDAGKAGLPAEKLEADPNAPAKGHVDANGKDATYEVPALAPTCGTDATGAATGTDGYTAGKKCATCGDWVEGGEKIAALKCAYINEVCTTAKKMNVRCYRCGDLQVLNGVAQAGIETTVAANAAEKHVWVDVEGSLTAATCNSFGTVTQECEFCTVEPKVVTLQKVAHTVEKIVEGAACLTGGGTVTEFCSVCKEELSKKTIAYDANAHEFEIGAGNKAADCLNTGVDHKICKHCGFTVINNTAALGHDVEYIVAVAPTCTAAGNTAGAKCKRCQAVLTASEEIAKLGHDDQTNASVIAGYAATCTTEGLSNGTKCLRCGEITKKQEKIAKYDHYSKNEDGVLVQYAEVVTVAATCKGAGRIGYVATECVHCDAAVIISYTNIPEHVWTATWEKKEVTCEEDGYEYKTCTCGATLVKEGSVVEATGHKNAAGTVFAAACSYADGFDHKCTNKNCDYPTKVVPVVHNYVMTPQVIDPCQGYKYNLYICEDCGHQKVDGVDTMTPVHNEEVISAPATGATPTPDKALATVYKCKDCGNVRTAYTPVGGISTKTEIKNLTNPGADFVEGTKKVQFVISIKGDKVEFHDFIAVFTYDKTALKFKSASITKELSGMTIAGATHSPDAGKVNLNAYVANDEDGKVTNVALTGEWQEFIVLEFEVLSEAFKDKTAGVLTPAANLTSATGGNYASFFFRASYDANGEVSVAGVNLATSNVTNLTTSIYKLGDANKDGVVNTADFAAVQKLILTDGYMAQADIDGDGKVAAKDLSLLQKLIVGSYTVKQLADGRK